MQVQKLQPLCSSLYSDDNSTLFLESCFVLLQGQITKYGTQASNVAFISGEASLYLESDRQVTARE